MLKNVGIKKYFSHDLIILRAAWLKQNNRMYYGVYNIDEIKYHKNMKYEWGNGNINV